MSLARRLTLLRDQKGVSLQTVADAVDMSKAHLWEIERGKKDNPSMKIVQSLALYYGVTVGYLLGEDPDAEDVPKELVQLMRASKRLSPEDIVHVEALAKSLADARKRKTG